MSVTPEALRQTMAIAILVLLCGSACRDGGASRPAPTPPTPTPTAAPPASMGDHLPPALAGCCAEGTNLLCDRAAFDAIGALCPGDGRVVSDPGASITSTSQPVQ